MTIEQTLKDNERLSRKEACALIQKALRLEKSTVEKKTIYPAQTTISRLFSIWSLKLR